MQEGCAGWLQVTGVFGSSMEVMISVCGEDPTQGHVFHCGDAYATVVSVDTEGNPVEVPFELAPATEPEQQRCRNAADRCACLALSSPPSNFFKYYSPYGRKMGYIPNLHRSKHLQAECCKCVSVLVGMGI